MSDALLEAVRGLWLVHPEFGPKPLLAKLRQQQPDLGGGNKEVREALTALKAKREATLTLTPTLTLTLARTLALTRALALALALALTLTLT